MLTILHSESSEKTTETWLALSSDEGKFEPVIVIKLSPSGFRFVLGVADVICRATDEVDTPRSTGTIPLTSMTSGCQSPAVVCARVQTI